MSWPALRGRSGGHARRTEEFRVEDFDLTEGGRLLPRSCFRYSTIQPRGIISNSMLIRGLKGLQFCLDVDGLLWRFDRKEHREQVKRSTCCIAQPNRHADMIRGESLNP